MFGLALGVFGATRGRALFIGFAALGTAVGGSQLRFWLRAPATPREWLHQHIGGMGISCIATITAFCVVNATHLGFGRWNLAAWFAPVIVGGGALALAQRGYRRRATLSASSSA